MVARSASSSAINARWLLAEMGEYRKKPVVINAVQFTGENSEEIGHFAGLAALVTGREKQLRIKTLEGILKVSPGDWVIRGVQGEYYPIKDAIFRETYEEVSE